MSQKLLFFFIILFITIIIYKYTKKQKYSNKIYNDTYYSNIGDLYFYGLNNIEKNYKRANINYNKVFLYEPDNINIPRIRKNLDIIKKSNYSNITDRIIIDNIDDELSLDINDYIININYDRLVNNINLFENIQNLHQNYNLYNNTQNNINLFENIEDTHQNNNLYNNDTQNVHDSIVNKTIQSSIKKLEKETNKDNNLKQISDFLLSNINNYELSDNKKDNIKKTINYIEENNNLIINNQKLEDNLILVGNKIINTNDENTKKNMINNLYFELSDCVKNNGEMYCLTGISNRIINSLNGIDKNVSIIPKWALREEMMRKCVKIREELEKDYNSEENNFSDRLKEKIKIDLKNEYVYNNNILTEEDFNNEIKDWIDYI